MNPEQVHSIKSQIAINPNPLTFDEYINFFPRPLELHQGYPTDGYLMLIALIKCYGLKKVVRLIPRELWEEVLNQVYPPT
jgi:hypothetical protein